MDRRLLDHYNRELGHLRELGAEAVRKMDGIEETTRFPLPKGLRLDTADQD